MGRGVRPQSVSDSLLCPTHYVTIFIPITMEKVGKKPVAWLFQGRGAITRNSQGKKLHEVKQLKVGMEGIFGSPKYFGQIIDFFCCFGFPQMISLFLRIFPNVLATS